MSTLKLNEGNINVQREQGRLELFKHLDKDTPIEIYYQEDATVNIGNYESTKLHFGLKVSCNLHQLDDTKDEIITYVNETINNKVNEILKEIGR